MSASLIDGSLANYSSNHPPQPGTQPPLHSLTARSGVVVNRHVVPINSRNMNHCQVPFLRLLTPALILALLTTAPATSRAATPQQEADECARNLQSISVAIQKYRKEKKDVPTWLSDLVPDYLDDPNLLVCPVTRRTGELKNKEYADPRISTSYVYEFSDKPAPGGGGTMRQWKRLQMALAGSIVPIVRCWHHEPVLNLSFDGKIFKSNLQWEEQLKELMDPSELSAEKLFARFAGGEVRGTFKTIDLSKFYNCPLDKPLQTDGKGPGPSLKNFPAGTNFFNGIPFHAGGVIQLYGGGLQAAAPGRYTNVVNGIPVGLGKVRRLHFLGAAGWATTNKPEIASVVVHYENQTQDSIPIVLDRHLRDWWLEPLNGPDTPIVVWRGEIEKNLNMTGPGSIYRFVWINPQPHLAITTLDFRSLLGPSAPFLLGITAETD